MDIPKGWSIGMWRDKDGLWKGSATDRISTIEIRNCDDPLTVLQHLANRIKYKQITPPTDKE